MDPSLEPAKSNEALLGGEGRSKHLAHQLSKAFDLSVKSNRWAPVVLNPEEASILTNNRLPLCTCKLQLIMKLPSLVGQPGQDDPSPALSHVEGVVHGFFMVVT